MFFSSGPLERDDGSLRFHTGFGFGMTALLGISLSPTVVMAVAIPSARATLFISTGVVVLMLFGMYLTTHYTFGETSLHVRCGPITVEASYDRIQRASPSSSVMSGYAMSLKRIEIAYDAGETILISPADREGFLAELRRRAPHARIDDREA